MQDTLAISKKLSSGSAMGDDRIISADQFLDFALT